MRFNGSSWGVRAVLLCLHLVLVLSGCTAHVGRDAAFAPRPRQASPADERPWRATDTFIAGESVRRALPKLVVAVACRGRIAWRAGYDSGTSQPEYLAPTLDTYRIGSLTKLITGVALLQLRDNGVLLLDDELSRYVPEAGAIIYPAEARRRITVRHLVTHSSGIPRLGRIDYTRGDHDITESELLGELNGLRLESPPGARTAYSNLAMSLAGLVVARAAGQSYRSYVAEHILRPLKMTGAVWEPESIASPRRLVPGRFQDGTPSRVPWRLGALESAGGLYATLDDVEKFMLFELEGPSANEPAVLSLESLRESQAPDALLSPTGSARFGVNWRIEHIVGLGSVASHTGSTLDYAASIALSPTRRVGVAMLMATGDSAVLAQMSLEALKRASVACPGNTASSSRSILFSMSRPTSAVAHLCAP